MANIVEITNRINEIKREALLIEWRQVKNRLAPKLKELEPDLALMDGLESELKSLGHKFSAIPAIETIVTEIQRPQLPDGIAERGIWVLERKKVPLTVNQVVNELKQYDERLSDEEELRRYQSVMSTAFKKKTDKGKLTRVIEGKEWIYSLAEWEGGGLM